MKTKIKAIILSCLTAASVAASGISANASGNDDGENARENSGVSNTGVNLDQPEVMTDPWIDHVKGYENNTTGTYTVTRETVYKVTKVVSV